MKKAAFLNRKRADKLIQTGNALKQGVSEFIENTEFARVLYGTPGRCCA